MMGRFDDFLPSRQAAQEAGIPLRALENARRLGAKLVLKVEAPPAHYIDGRAFYRRDDVERLKAAIPHDVKYEK